MRTRLIQLDDQHTVFVLLTHPVQKHLATLAVEVCELVEARVSRSRCRDAIQVGGLKLPLHFAFGLHTLGGELASTKTIMTDNSRTQAVPVPEQALIDLRDRPSPDLLRVIAIGSPQVVQMFVITLFRYGYARPDEGSRQLPTVNPGEVMRILTKRVSAIE